MSNKYFRYSLRTLLIVLLLFSIGFAYICSIRDNARLRSEAQEYMMPRGIRLHPYRAQQAPKGGLEKFFYDPYKTKLWLTVANNSLPEKKYSLLKRFPDIKVIDVNEGSEIAAGNVLKNIANPHLITWIHFRTIDVNNEIMLGLKECRDLEELTFDECDMSQANLAMLPLFSKLKEIYLYGCKGIDDTDVNILSSKLGPNIKVVILSNTNVSDVGLSSLCKLNSLERIFVNDTKVDGSGLASLSKESSLNELGLDNTQIDPKNLQYLLRLNTSKFRLLLEGATLEKQDLQKIEARWGTGAIER